MNEIKFSINNRVQSMQEVVKQISRGYEKGIAGEISDLVSKGLMVIKIQGAAIYQAADQDGILIGDRVFIELKDQEYIAKLETENKELRTKLESIAGTLNWKG